MENKERATKIFGAIGLVVGVVILLAFGGLIVGSVLDSSAFADIVTTGTNTNETLAVADNTTTLDFGILSTFSGATCTLLDVINATGAVTIDAGNYTQPTSCQILATTGSELLPASWNVSYDFTNTQSQTAGLNITGLTEGFSGFVSGLVAFLAIIGLLIGIVWLLGYLGSLFSKDEGIQSFGAN